MDRSHVCPQGNPRASILWKGAILGTIVKSIATAIHADFDTLQSWSGSNYIVQGWDGRYGAVAFAGPQGELFNPASSSLAGAFYSAKSSRGPNAGEGQQEREVFFRGCPPQQRELAETEAVQFLLFEIHPGGPCITTAFWNDGEFLTAADPWHTVLENGVDLIRIELIEDMEEALAEWQEAFDLSQRHVDMARSIYERRLRKPDGGMTLSESECTFLSTLSEEPHSLPTCRRSFADIRIIVP